jgi:hypothetical protein
VTAALGIVYRQMVLDARAAAAGPGGHMGAATGSSAAGSNPGAGTSEKSLPDPPPTTLRQDGHPILLAIPGSLHSCRTAAAVKRSLLDSGEDRHTLARPEMTPF